MTTASKPHHPRIDWFEALLAVVTACCLVTQLIRAGSGPIGFWLAFPWGLATALMAFRAAQNSTRVWVSLALANLAVSAWSDDSTSLAALWLPALTAAALRAIEPREIALTTTADVSDANIVPPAAANDHDRQHTTEWSQVHDSSGAKTIRGVARLTFRSGERQIELHLAFCPSFSAAPVLAFEQSSGPSVRIKTTQVMPYGARIEVQRADAVAWSVVAFEFTAALPTTSERPATTRLAS